MGSVLACRRPLRLVQIGANDGVINNPLYSFVMKHSDRTEILLIEPNVYLLPILAGNYRDHPAHTIAGVAVGGTSSICLYTVASEYWPDCQPPYAKSWPMYRAPTGVTSSDRHHVERWLDEDYSGHSPARFLKRSIRVRRSS